MLQFVQHCSSMILWWHNMPTYCANQYVGMFDAGLYVVIVNNSINFHSWQTLAYKNYSLPESFLASLSMFTELFYFITQSIILLLNQYYF